jgi:hypothetical protein
MTAFLNLLVSSALMGAVDVNVYDDEVYLYLDKLNAAGMLQSYMPNQRPLTRGYVAMLVAEAKAYVKDKKESEQLKDMIGELDRRFAAVPSESNVTFVALDSFSMSYTATDQKEFGVPDNGLGSTGGRVQPLLSYNNGDHFDRNNVYSYSVHRIKASPYFAAYLQPKYFVRSGEDSTGGVGLYRGYIKSGHDNFELQVGRDDIRWGPGENALFFSGNARPLDMVKVSTPSPFRLPGLLKNLGHLRATAFFSYLGNDYRPRKATLSGYRIDYSPVKWWDLGFDHAVFLWGEGAETPAFKTAVRSFLGFLSNSRTDRASSNHLMGVDTTVHIPQAMGMQVYAKLLLEDTQAETAYMLKSDSSWLGGVYFPKIDGLVKLSIRGEAVYTGQFPYRHSIYTDGFALEDKFIGYDAGPDTWSGSFTSKYQFNFDEFVKLDFRYLRRSGDHYKLVLSTFGENIGDNIGIYRDRDGPEERNRILRIGGQKMLSKCANLYAEIGYDRKGNAGFVNGKSGNDVSFQIRLSFHPATPAVR